MSDSRNITVDPQSLAEPVAHPEIAEILDLRTGDVVDVRNFINSRTYGEFIKERVYIRESLYDAPLFACALCGTPVYVVANPDKRFFFRHCRENGSCPARTRSKLSQTEILARKYHGLRESEAHRKVKRLIERSLIADSCFKPESIAQERRWRSSSDPKVWRQPDVQAVNDGRRFAFEVQLSTTFLSVVVERRQFYREEGASLIWVFGHFDPSYRRMTTDDLLFSNNANIFVVDDETVRISEETRSFHLRCHFLRFEKTSDGLAEVWDERLVRFIDLSCDLDAQQVYFFDYSGEKVRLEQGDEQLLRDRMFGFWKRVNPHFDHTPEGWAEWGAIKSQFSARGIELPDDPGADGSFRGMMHAILSASKGAPVGWQFSNLIEVAHRVAEAYPEHLLRFGFALEVSGNRVLLDTLDHSGRWKDKRRKLHQQISAGDPKYYPDPKWLAAFEFLFPAVAARVSSFIGRHWPLSKSV